MRIDETLFNIESTSAPTPASVPLGVEDMSCEVEELELPFE